jgi:ribulose-bisphosphate carboxylase large chain
MVSPGIVGLDALRAITALEPGIPVFAHPAFIGSYVLGRDGISCGALFGSIMRMSGADVTIFPNYGGRFPLSKEDCLDIARACREEFGGFREIFPSPAGGMELANIADMTRSYGKDYLILVGGGLFNLGPDLVVNCREFLLETERSRNMS